MGVPLNPAAYNAMTHTTGQMPPLSTEEPSPRTFMDLLRTSSLLQDAMPYVRQVSLLETLKRCKEYKDAKHTCMDNIAGSPYVPDEIKNVIVELMLDGQWDELRNRLQCRSTSNEEEVPSEFSMFRCMVVHMFTCSRKIRAFPEAHRCQLGSDIHSAISIEELKELAMNALENSTTLTAHDRQQIANDLWDDRYDLLLLPDRFDCDEKPRQRPEVEERADADDDYDCPVCLGTYPVDRRLQRCGHRFCHRCLDRWAARFPPRSRFTCPICRRSSRRRHAEAI